MAAICLRTSTATSSVPSAQGRHERHEQHGTGNREREKRGSRRVRWGRERGGCECHLSLCVNSFSPLLLRPERTYKHTSSKHATTTAFNSFAPGNCALQSPAIFLPSRSGCNVCDRARAVVNHKAPSSEAPIVWSELTCRSFPLASNSLMMGMVDSRYVTSRFRMASSLSSIRPLLLPRSMMRSVMI